MRIKEIYREIILENIDYDIVDTICSTQKTIRRAGDDSQRMWAKLAFIKLDITNVQPMSQSMQ